MRTHRPSSLRKPRWQAVSQIQGNHEYPDKQLKPLPVPGPRVDSAKPFGQDGYMIPESVARVLAANGLTALEFEPGSTPTAPMAAARIGVEVGQIAKSLLFRAKDGSYHMVVCAGDKRVNSGKLKALVGSKASMADADETLRVTGFPPGGVCPFGVTGVTVWIDDSLSVWPVVYPAAGTDATGVPTTHAQLLEITGGGKSSVTD